MWYLNTNQSLFLPPSATDRSFSLPYLLHTYLFCIFSILRRMEICANMGNYCCGGRENSAFDRLPMSNETLIAAAEPIAFRCPTFTCLPYPSGTSEGYILFVNGKFSRAGKAFRTLAGNDSNALLRVNVAACYLRRDRWSVAINWLEESRNFLSKRDSRTRFRIFRDLAHAKLKKNFLKKIFG